MKTIDLTKILKGYENKWVALNSDSTKVIASGESFYQAFKESQSSKCINPIFMKVPSFDKCFVG